MSDLAFEPLNLNEINKEADRLTKTSSGINDVYVKELGGEFNDLVNMQEFENDPSKLIDITRDMLLSGHIYHLFCSGDDELAESLLTKLKSSRMIATKWLMQAKVINVVEWITNDLMPSDLEQPSQETTIKKKR